MPRWSVEDIEAFERASGLGILPMNAVKLGLNAVAKRRPELADPDPAPAQEPQEAPRVCGGCSRRVEGVCRRYPPQMVLVPIGNQPPVIYQPDAWFPAVSENTPACGEWEKIR